MMESGEWHWMCLLVVVRTINCPSDVGALYFNGPWLRSGKRGDHRREECEGRPEGSCRPEEEESFVTQLVLSFWLNCFLAIWKIIIKINRWINHSVREKTSACVSFRLWNGKRICVFAEELCYIVNRSTVWWRDCSSSLPLGMHLCTCEGVHTATEAICL